ncbi:hypothetical protein CEXT_813631 [Caerostris extrusa]|uniref:Uncharacterized protein n=1 Tax=Caerostris extrusa TaxID=172846 RepID=A0AAV4YCB0_CAEEX|nr:hypothetical protein CEXT_813631 [Caerostris extrusa]
MSQRRIPRVTKITFRTCNYQEFALLFSQREKKQTISTIQNETLVLFASRDPRKPFFQRRSFQFRFATERLMDFFSFSIKTVTKCFIKKEIPSFFFLFWNSTIGGSHFRVRQRCEMRKKKSTAYCIRVELDETEILKSMSS